MSSLTASIGQTPSRLPSAESLVPAVFSVAALVILLWELVTRSRSDIRILRSLRGQIIQNAVYLLSRLSAFAFIITTLVFQAAPPSIEICGQLLTVSRAFYLISILFTSLLLYYRLRAVFSSQSDWYIIPIFGILWATVIASCVTPFLGIQVTSPGSDTESSGNHCTITLDGIKQFVSAALIVPLLYTMLAFMFIAGRRVQRCKIDFSASNGIGEFIKVDCVIVLSRGLFEDGQALYLSVILLQMISVVLFLLGTSISARTMLISVTVAVFNIAACRVYISSENQKLAMEKSRKASVIRKLGAQSDLEASLASLGGITVTKTVETFN